MGGECLHLIGQHVTEAWSGSGLSLPQNEMAPPECRARMNPGISGGATKRRGLLHQKKCHGPACQPFRVGNAGAGQIAERAAATATSIALPPAEDSPLDCGEHAAMNAGRVTVPEPDGPDLAEDQVPCGLVGLRARAPRTRPAAGEVTRMHGLKMELGRGQLHAKSGPTGFAIRSGALSGPPVRRPSNPGAPEIPQSRQAGILPRPSLRPSPGIPSSAMGVLSTRGRS